MILLNIPCPCTDGVTATIKPNAYENIWIYSILIVKLLHVSVTFCDHLQGSIFTKDILKKQPNKYKDIKYEVLNV
jgi:hypothetical protein